MKKGGSIDLMKRKKINSALGIMSAKLHSVSNISIAMKPLNSRRFI